MYNYKMKFIFFVIVVIILYFIASLIVVKKSPVELQTTKRKVEYEHYQTDNNDANNDLLLVQRPPNKAHTRFQPMKRSNKSKNLLPVVIPATQPFIPSPNEILIKIETDFLEPQFMFNIASLPVETLYPNKNDDYFKESYGLFVQRNVARWNEIFPKYFSIKPKVYIHYANIKPIYIIKTIKDFVLKTNVGVIYNGELLTLQLTYYGTIEPPRDPFREDTVYSFQMTEIRYVSNIESVPTGIYSSLHRDIPTTMNDQLEYVNKINRMHCDENAEDGENQLCDTASEIIGY
jgi:hypothetical protein